MNYSRLSLQVVFLALLMTAPACERGTSNVQTKAPAEDTAAVDTAAVDIAAEDSLATPPGKQDGSFLLDAYSYGLMLVHYSRQAAQQAGTPAVKSFAKQSAQWHEDLNKELAQMASQQKVVLPDSAGADVEEYSAELQALPTPDFEQRYLEVLQQIQQKTLDVYTSAAENAADTTLRNWAIKKVPDLQAHAQAVQELTKILKTK